MLAMGDTLHFTIRYSPLEDGWVMAQVEEVPGALSQGRTREEARENVLDALRLMLTTSRAPMIPTASRSRCRSRRQAPRPSSARRARAGAYGEQQEAVGEHVTRRAP